MALTKTLAILAVITGHAIAANTTAAASSYDEGRAMRAMGFSAASYCSMQVGHTVDNWSCDVCAKFPDVQATTFSDPGVISTDQNGFVAFDPNDGADGSVVIAFTGTNLLSIENWIDDIDTVFAHYDSCDGCEVHKGFYDNWKAVRDDVVVLTMGYLALHPGAKLRITGHSLGAAVAVHAAVYFENDLGISVEATYTFGEPRVGNYNFARWAEATLVGGHFRVTHMRDPVPHLPPQKIGFEHSTTEVFYNQIEQSNGTHVVCEQPEDYSCSNQYAVLLNVLDHLFYVGYDLVTNFLSCEL